MAAPAFGEDGAVNLGADTLAALVDRCPFPAGLLDLNDWRYVELNDGVAEMLGLDRRPVGADLRQFVQDPVRATARLRLLRDAGLHLFETSYDFQAADGTMFDRVGWAMSVSGRRDLVLAVAGPTSARSSSEDFPASSSASVTVGVLDDQWRVEAVSDGVSDLVGWRADQWGGRPLLGEVHPGDSASLVQSALRSVDSGGGADLETRIRHRDGGWRKVRLTVIPRPSKSELPPMMIAIRAAAKGRRPDREHWSDLVSRL